MTAIDVPVTVLGLAVAPGDVIHADRHGAVIIPSEHLERLPEAVAHVVQSERPVLEAARAPDFDVDRLFEAWGMT